MTQETFHDFWGKWSVKWYASSIVLNGIKTPIASLCELKQDYDRILNERYQRIKRIVKDCYFKDPNKLLNRYKRAAVVAYAINEASPLHYKDSTIKDDLDPIFLKQRLAFFVALGSILQDYSEDDVNKLSPPYFDFESLGKQDIIDGEDDFLQSIYKDLFYADVYENYNVLTMANVFGLLTERASKLGSLTPIESKAE